MNKKPKSYFYFLTGLAMLAFFVIAPGFKYTDSIDPVAAGKQIYTEGTSPTGKDIFALMSGVKVPASVLPCVNCHGSDGAGRPEGGVTPSNLQWDILTKDNGGQFNNRRTHPPYTDKNLKRAITMGFDPAGNEILKAMPRYELGQEDLSYLLAYLKVLGKEKESGIDGATIKTGFVLPSEKEEPAKRLALQKILEAYFTDINEKGGIYSRQLDLHFFAPDFIDQKDTGPESCFAIGNYWNLTGEQHIADWASQMEIPIVGAVSSILVEESLDNKYVFYLYPGILKQAEALGHFLAGGEDFSNRSIVLLHDQSEETKGVIELVETACQQLKPEKVKQVLLTNATDDLKLLIKQLKKEGVNTVFYFSAPGGENAFFKMAHDQAWYPEFLCLGTRTDIQPSEIPKLFDQRIFLAYPNWLNELSENGWELYQSLKSKYHLSGDFQNLQISTLGAAMIYVEAVRNCGRKLTREKLITALEKLYDYKTGLVPPVSYGLNKRVGSQKVYITSVDLERSALKLETIIKK